MAKTITITYTKPADGAELNIAKFGISPTFVLTPSYVDAKNEDGADLFPNLKNPEGGLGINFDAEKFYQINTMHPGVLLAFKRAYVDSLTATKMQYTANDPTAAYDPSLQYFTKDGDTYTPYEYNESTWDTDKASLYIGKEVKTGVGTCVLTDVSDLDALYFLELAGDANAPMQKLGFVAVAA